MLMLTQTELNKKIAAHKEWHSSRSQKGSRLDLSAKEKKNVIERYHGESLLFEKEISYKNVHFSGSILTKAQFGKCDLSQSQFRKSDLTGADLTGADLTRADLTDAILTNADLTDAILTNADLLRTILTNANLKRADLTGADLTGAKLTGAKLAETNLTNTILANADLTNANLTEAILTGTNLTGTDLTGALFLKTKVSFKQLAAAKFQKILVDAHTLRNLGINVALDSTLFTLSKDQNNDFLLSPLTRTEANDTFNSSKNENVKSLLLAYGPNSNENKNVTSLLLSYPPRSSELSNTPVFSQKPSKKTGTVLNIHGFKVTIQPQEFTLAKTDAYFKFK